MMKIGKGFHNQIISLLVVIFLFTNTAYSIDLSEKTYLRKKLSLDTKKDKPRIVCTFLAASYQNNILKHNLLPEKAFAILNKEMGAKDFGGYIVPDSADNRPFVPIKGLLLATGKAYYIDREDFESKGEEIIFVDEYIYNAYSELIHSGEIRIDEIDPVSMASLPDNFIPEGHFNRANRIISEVKKMVKKRAKNS